MNTEQAVSNILKLPTQYKGVLAGVLITTLALFLPWYSELDTFGKGVRYNALTGPTSLLGLTLLIINITTLVYLFLYAQNSKKTQDKVKAPLLEKWHGITFLYISFVLISIYFHNDFGQSNADKTLGFGFYLGLTGSIISFFFGIIQFQSERKNIHSEYLKKEIASSTKENTSEPEQTIELPQFRERLDRFSDDNPVYKERIQRQKQIEEKIKHKLNHKK